MFVAPIQTQPDRVAPRSRVLMNATLITPEGAVCVRIRDISAAGAQVWAPTAVPDDCDAILKRGSFFIAAKVVRSSEKTIGLRFYRELPDREFASAFQQKSTALIFHPQPVDNLHQGQRQL